MKQSDFGSPHRQKLQLAICALLIWLPLPLGSNRLWSNGLLILLISLIGVSWAYFHGKRDREFSKPLKKGLPMVACLLLTQFWVAAQYFIGWTLNPGETLLYLLLGLSYTLLFVMVLDVFHTRAAINLLLTTLIISGACQAFYGAMMTLSGIEWGFFHEKEHYRGVATGTFINRNHLAGYLEMTLACGIGLLLALRDGRPITWKSTLELLAGPKARIRLALVIMVIGLVMTRSRMGNTAFFSSLLIVGGTFAVLDKGHRKRNMLILASLILIDVLVISQYFGLEKLQQRLLNTQFEDQVENGTITASENEIRDDVFRYAEPLLKQHAIFGSGAGSFEAAFQPFPGKDIRLHFEHAHSDYLEFSIEYGIIGFGLLGTFVLLALNQSLQSLRKIRSNYRSGLGFAGAMGLLALMVHSATDFNLQIPANAASYIAIASLGLLGRYHKSKLKTGDVV